MPFVAWEDRYGMLKSIGRATYNALVWEERRAKKRGIFAQRTLLYTRVKEVSAGKRVKAMSEQENRQASNEQGGAGTVPVKPAKERLPEQQPPRTLKPWKVILHNDDVNEVDKVVKVICQLTHLKKQDAVARTLEAHRSGAALLLMTHQERAELYVEQFATYKLTVTAEPDAA
jgi:ATP-dependent Clp protease adaptor protein ClpS